jgi:hypothetical protein
MMSYYYDDDAELLYEHDELLYISVGEREVD